MKYSFEAYLAIPTVRIMLLQVSLPQDAVIGDHGHTSSEAMNLWNWGARSAIDLMTLLLDG